MSGSTFGSISIKAAALPPRHWAVLGAAAVLLVLLISGIPSSGPHSAVSVRNPAGFNPAPAVLHAAAVTGPGDWPMYLGGVNHQNIQLAETTISPTTAPNLTLKWTFPTSRQIVTQPIVSAGKVFFGSWNGFEYAVNSTTGKLLWKTYTGMTTCPVENATFGVTSSATASNGRLYFGGGGEDWLALSTANGTPMWSVYTGNNSGNTSVVGGGHYNWASPLIYKGSAYIGISSTCDAPLVRGSLLMVNLTNHSVVHTLYTVPNGTLGGGVWGTPTVDPATNTIFIATGNFWVTKINLNRLDDSVISLDATTLKVKDHWHIPSKYFVKDGDFGSTPVLYKTAAGKARVGAVNKDGYFFSFPRGDLSSPVQTIQISKGPSVAPPAFDGQKLYFGAVGGNLSGTTVRGSIQAVNATTGTLVWGYAMPGAVQASPLVSNGLVVGVGGKELVVLDAAKGTLLYHYNATMSFYGSATISHGWLYVGNNNGSLLAFTLAGNGSGGGGHLPHPGAPTGKLPASPTAARPARDQ